MEVLIEVLMGALKWCVIGSAVVTLFVVVSVIVRKIKKGYACEEVYCEVDKEIGVVTRVDRIVGGELFAAEMRPLEGGEVIEHFENASLLKIQERIEKAKAAIRAEANK